MYDTHSAGLSSNDRSPLLFGHGEVNLMQLAGSAAAATETFAYNGLFGCGRTRLGFNPRTFLKCVYR
jgi:hypothetical protein